LTTTGAAVVGPPRETSHTRLPASLITVLRWLRASGVVTIEPLGV